MASEDLISVTRQEFSNMQQQILEYKERYYEENNKFTKEKKNNASLMEKIQKYKKLALEYQEQNNKLKASLASANEKKAPQEKKEGRKFLDRGFFSNFTGSKDAAQEQQANTELQQLREEYQQFKEVKKRESELFSRDRRRLEEEIQLLKDQWNCMKLEISHQLAESSVEKLKMHIRNALKIESVDETPIAAEAESSLQQTIETEDNSHSTLEPSANKDESQNTSVPTLNSDIKEVDDTSTEQLIENQSSEQNVDETQNNIANLADKSKTTSSEDESNVNNPTMTNTETIKNNTPTSNGKKNRRKKKKGKSANNGQSTSNNPQVEKDLPSQVNDESMNSTSPTDMNTNLEESIPKSEYLKIQNEISSYKDKLDSYCKKYEAGQAIIKELEGEKNKLLLDVKKYSEDNQAYEKKIKLLEDKHSELLKEIETYTEISKQEKNKIKEMENTHMLLLQDIKSMNDKNLKCEIKIKDLEEKKDSLFQEVKSKNATSKNSDARIKELEEKQTKLQQEVTQYSESNKSKDAKIKDLEEKQSKLLKDIEAYKQRLSREKNQLKQKNVDLEKLLKSHEKLLSESQEMEVKYDTSKQLITSYTKRLEEATIEKEKHQTEIAKCNKEIQENNKKIKDLETNIHTLTEANRDFKYKVAHYEDKLNDLNKTLKEKENELSEEIRQKDVLIFRLKEFKSMMKKREKELQVTIDNLKQEIQLYRNQVKEYISVWVKDLTSSFFAKLSQEELKALEGEILNLSIENSDLKEKYEATSKENKAMKVKIDDIKLHFQLQFRQEKETIKQLKKQLKMEREKQQQQWETSSSISVDTSDTSISCRPPFSPAPSHDNLYSESDVSRSQYEIVSKENNILLKKIANMQTVNWQQEEKIKRLERGIERLREEIDKKSKIILEYIQREKLGRLTPQQEQNKQLLAKKNQTFMGSLFNRSANSGNSALGVEVQAQMQAVLEETILKNIQLSDDFKLLGEEVEKLSNENRELKDIIKTQITTNVQKNEDS